MSGFHPTFRSLCLEAVAYGSSGGASNLAVKTLTIGALSQAASWQRSLCIANATDRIDTVLLKALVTCCARVARWQEALQILCSSFLSHSLQASAVTFNAAISACAASQQWQLAINFVEEMEDQKLAPDSLTFNSAFFVRLVCQIFLTGLVHCGSRGATGKCCTFLSHLIASLGLMLAFGEAGYWQRALNVLNTFSARSCHCAGEIARVFTYRDVCNLMLFDASSFERITVNDCD